MIKTDTAALVVSIIAFHLISVPPQDSLQISTTEELAKEFANVPCKNEDRLNAVRALFEKMGAPPSDVAIQKFKNVENVVVVKQGTTAEKIVIGAHYDKTSEGCGAVDNWTGIVALAHLYRSLKTVPSKKTFVFVAFGKEEIGLIGSKAMVAAIPKDQLEQYCSMINIDSLGLAIPQVPKNMSGGKLDKLAIEVSKTMEMPFAYGVVPGGDSDSSSFANKNIPSVTITGLSEAWPSILHSKNDQATKIIDLSIYLGYRLALAMILRVDQSDCNAYRLEPKQKP